jgi:Protein of unknown function (DUF3891)
MILRPLDLPPAGSDQFVDAWPVVEHLQRQSYQSCWMITQPSHAALSGEIAARLISPKAPPERDSVLPATAKAAPKPSPQIPKLDPSLIRAIALHDAGWGQPDAEIIMRSRGRDREPPKSFLQTEITEFLPAWTQSIEIAQKESPTGGFMVSRHFWRLAEHRLAHASDPQPAQKKLRAFLSNESARQKKLTAKNAGTPEEYELERLTDLLQFCDLLSLYICSGAQQRVRLPEYFGVTTTLVVDGTTYRLDPPLVEPGTKFSVAALRYPTTKAESARELHLVIS